MKNSCKEGNCGLIEESICCFDCDKKADCAGLCVYVYVDEDSTVESIECEKLIENDDIKNSSEQHKEFILNRFSKVE